MIGDELRRKLVELIKGNTPKQTSICEVLSVDENKLTCTVKELETDAELFQVRLNAGKTTLQTVLFPKVGSMVLVGLIGNDTRARYVSMVSEVDKIYLNGGDNGGLTITPELVTQLGKLSARVDGIISAINSGTPAPGAADGGAALHTSIKLSLQSIVDNEDFSNIENEKIKH